MKILSIGSVAILWSLIVAPWVAAQDVEDDGAPAAPGPSQTQMIYPIDVASDSQGTLYIADRQLPGIWRFADGQLSVLFQAEKRYRTPLNAIRCLAVDQQDRLFAGCSTTTEIYRLDDGQPVALTKGAVSVPMNMISDGDSIVACDLKMRYLVQLPTSGGEISELAEVQGAKAVVKDGDAYLVLTGLPDAIVRVNPADGSVTPVVSGRPFDYPADMVALSDGTLIVSDSYGKCLWRVSGGVPEKWVTDDRFSNPVGLCLRNDQVIVVDSRANALFAISPDGSVEVLWQGQPIPES